MEKLQVKKWLWVFFFDGKATLVIGTHTHVPTNDSRILDGGTAYQTDAGMCGDYNSVIGMKKEISLLTDFLKIHRIKIRQHLEKLQFVGQL